MQNKAWSLRAGIVGASAIGVAMLVAGCVYQLGSSLPPDLKTMYLPTFINNSGEPQIEINTTQAAISEFQKDGTLKVVHSPSEADLVVEVTLTALKLEPLRYNQNDPKTTLEYRMRIDANVVVTKVKTKEIFAKTSVEGETTFIFAGDLTSSKQGALPAATYDLAKKIVSSVVEVW